MASTAKTNSELKEVNTVKLARISHHIPWKQYTGVCYFKPIFDFMQSVKHRKVRASKQKVHKKYKCTRDCGCREKMTKFKETMKSGEFESKLSDLSKQQMSYIDKIAERMSQKMHGEEFSTPEKLMCLSIHKTSETAYKYLRNLISFPDDTNLNKFRRTIQFDTGVTATMLNRLMEVSNTMKNIDKVVVLMFGSVDIRPYLAYSTKLDKMLGFEDWGSDYRGPKLVDTAFVFGIRGIGSDWFLPVAYSFSDENPKISKLVRLFKEVVQCVKISGFRIVASVCDEEKSFMAALEKLRDETIRKRGPDTLDNSGTIIVHGVEIVPLYNPIDLLIDFRNQLFINDLEFFVNSKERPLKWDHERELSIIKDKKALTASWAHIELAFLKDCKNEKSKRKMPSLTKKNVSTMPLERSELDSALNVLNGKVATNLDKFSFENEIPPEGYFTSFILNFFEKLSEALIGGRKEEDPKYELKTLLTNDSFHHEFFEIAKEQIHRMRFVDKNTRKSIDQASCLKNLLTTIKGFQIIWKKLKEMDFHFVKTRSFNLELFDQFSIKNSDLTCLQFSRDFKNYCYLDITV